MPKVTREQLAGYLDDALSEAETAQVEQALRESEPLRRTLRTLMQERDRGEHSLGAIWQRQRLSCPSRDQLGGFLLGALDAAWREYIDFHLHTIGCSYCHGTAGQGGGGRTGGLRLAQMGIAYPAFLNQLRQPQDEMPPYVASVLPDKDVADIYAFVASLPPPPDAKSIPLLNP